ncbi:MAG: hypothetical protein Q8927_07820 [Bacteroidota bacterium]|nr:hypothetical protein [Bacteroidota bacterium]MDP4216095.1 hypothetical protein [Bacteroidota bacterium]MDP4245285.1 hypothetical protein [Bacteroidota bacterium]MDP4253058.1 hypothetical protein [Bacteroidota bacterium]MDP4260205.1 hypothetical protein [Bacteroidota bacterium]
MNNEATFPFSLDFEGTHYDGLITPSGETDKYGMPVYFRITIGDKFFAYICCDERNWRRHESKDTGDEGLLQQIGELINRRYE